LQLDLFPRPPLCSPYQRDINLAYWIALLSSRTQHWWRPRKSLEACNLKFSQPQPVHCGESAPAERIVPINAVAPAYEQEASKSAAASPPTSFSSSQDIHEPQDGDEDRKRFARMQRNRESASLSRQRKKMLSDEKENQLQELQKHCAGLNGGPCSCFLSGLATYGCPKLNTRVHIGPMRVCGVAKQGL